jgi:hypothetical protein
MDRAGTLFVERLQPREYVGVDIAPGEGVDRICPAERPLADFGRGSFDVVVCTEVLERVRLPQEACDAPPGVANVF